MSIDLNVKNTSENVRYALTYFLCIGQSNIGCYVLRPYGSIALLVGGVSQFLFYIRYSLFGEMNLPLLSNKNIGGQ